jgi:GT2 family glycosyltransferase
MTRQASDPTVSIVIVNYNGREHLNTCLDSLAHLDYPADQLEIIIVDNASTDGSIQSLQSPRNFRLIQNNSNTGFSVAANQGLNAARAEFVAFLNNDMRVDAQWLTALLSTLTSRNSIACAGSVVMSWDGGTCTFAGRPTDAFRLDSTPPPLPKPSTDQPILFASGGAALFKRSLMLELGGFDSDYFMYHEDVDLGWRLWLKGYECVLSSQSLVFHREGATSQQLGHTRLQYLSQKHALATIFKTLEPQSLETYLPVFFYYLLERSLSVLPARLSFKTVLNDFFSELPALILKRQHIQRTRTIPDADLFAKLGLPFGSFLNDPHFRQVQAELNQHCQQIGDESNLETILHQWLHEATLRHTQNSRWTSGAGIKHYLNRTLPVPVIELLRQVKSSL